MSISAREVLRLLNQGSYALLQSEDRANLNGALFDGSGSTLVVASTDGHRLATAISTHDGAFPTMLLAPRALSELRRLCEGVGDADVSVALVTGMAFFAHGETVLSAKVRDDVFPPYRKLGITPVHHVTLPRQELQAAIKRVAMVSKKEDSGQLTLTFSHGQLRITTRDGNGEDAIDCACDFEFANSVHAQYLMEAISVVADDDVRINLADALAPMTVEPASSNECCGLVMPMRK